jgi:hypothetical protein
MAFANTSISDIIATTIQSRSKMLADNFTNNNPLLFQMNKSGNIKPFSGGNVILEEIAYNDSSTTNAASYSGYDTLDITPNSPISAAQFNIKQYAAAVTISGLEQLENAGKEKMIDLLEGRIAVAEGELKNKLDTDLYSDGTGNGSKQLTGLAAAVASTATSGTYGGINRATWSFWQNVSYDATTDGGAAATASNIQKYMDAVAIQLVRGKDRPNLIVADANYYSLYLQSLQAIQRVTSETMAGAGFTSLKYFGVGGNADVVLGDGVGGNQTANTMYFLNTNYLKLRPHRNRNFVPIGGDRQAVNQDATVKLIGWAGNLTCSAPRLQGVLKD